MSDEMQPSGPQPVNITEVTRENAVLRAKLAQYDPTADIEYHPVVVNLRAENARLVDQHERLQAGYQQLERERGRLTTAVRFKEQTDKLNGVLRAHVAALVRTGQDVLETRSMVDEWDRPDTYLVALKAALDAPDLAALVAREQKREVVIAAARECEAMFGHERLFERLGKALAALDAVETP